MARKPTEKRITKMTVSGGEKSARISAETGRYLDGRKLSFQSIYPLRADRKCRFCENPLSGRQTSWCSEQCSRLASDEMQFRRGSSIFIRLRVFERDRGICAVCGIDGERLKKISDAAYLSLYDRMLDLWMAMSKPAEMPAYLWHREQLRFESDYFKDARRLWKDTPLSFGLSTRQADHIREVADGGAHALDNLQTLCVLCHKRKTAVFLRDRRKKRSEISVFEIERIETERGAAVSGG